MKQYLSLLNKILIKGNIRNDRTKTGTISLFGEQLRFDMQKGFPIITTKKIYWHGILHEILWSLSGNTNIKYLNDNNVHIWDKWADKNGELGPIYGAQWRNFNNENIDQIQNIINEIKTNPDSRRLLVVTYNPAQIDKMSLPPCPALFQFYVNNNFLSMHLYQRSADMFLGVPFDISGYALILELFAKVCKLQTKELIISYGDAHIYLNHIEQVKEQLKRKPLKLPKIKIEYKDNIFDFNSKDIKLCNYKSYPKISGKIAV